MSRRLCWWPMGFWYHPKSFDWDLDFWTLDLGLTILKERSNHRRYSESQVLNFASWCIHVYLLAFTSSPDETKSTCTVERLFAFTPNHLLVRHNYFLHNLQLFADFDFSVLQRVKVANSGHRDSLSSGPGWFRKQNSLPRREASRQPGEGRQKNSYQTL